MKSRVERGENFQITGNHPGIRMELHPTLVALMSSRQARSQPHCCAARRDAEQPSKAEHSSRSRSSPSTILTQRKNRNKKKQNKTRNKMSSHATLGAAADDRKARLAKLKSLKRKQPEPEESREEEPAPQSPSNDTTTTAPPTTDIARLHLSGRNYDFETKGPKLGFEAPPTLALAAPTLEDQASALETTSLQRAAADAAQAADKGIDLFNLQPKKPNWDLKRELHLRMAALDVRTENALARLVRERLAEKKAGAAAVGGGEGAADGEAGAEGMLDGAALVEGLRVREREEEEEARREREVEAEEFGMP